MLNEAKTLNGYKLNCLDGVLGKVKEFYFDDQYWTVRYLVADAGNWLMGRQVLISAYSLGTVNREEKEIVVDLTKKQIEGSPPLGSDKPVSRQFETSYYAYYSMPLYWGGPHAWGGSENLERDRSKWTLPKEDAEIWDPFLRSTSMVTGHSIQATDGEIGHVEDFVIEADNWIIRYLIVDTRNWWPGKKVLISPEWIDRVSWSESKLFVNLTREAIKLAPEYTEGSLANRDYESGLHRHYDRPGYWADELAARE